MSRNNNAQVTYCRFPPPVPASKFYTCYKRETCCEQGCCINGPYHIYQVWYYWLVFLIVFGIISGGSWFCRRRSRAPRRASRSTPATSRNCFSCSYPRCNRRRCEGLIVPERREVGIHGSRTQYEDSIVLDRLFVSFRNRNVLGLGDPPSYSSVLTADNSIPPPKFCPLYSYYGPPPTYSSMFKSVPSQNQQLGASPSAPSCDLAGSSSGVTQIQVHVEGHGNVPTNSSTVQAANGENEIRNDCTRTCSSGTSTVNNGSTNAVTTINVSNAPESDPIALQGVANQEQSNEPQKDM